MSKFSTPVFFFGKLPGGAVYGAVGGLILSKFYEKIHAWVQQKYPGKMDTLFKLLFYPVVALSVLWFILGGLGALFIGIVPVIISIGATILSRYLYAKMMVSRVGSLYENK